jgi:hypothetical protein
MAQVTINKSDNQILVSFPHGIDTFRVGVLQAGAGSTSKGVIIQDTSNSKKILREVPFDQIKQSDGTQFGSTVSATVTALNTLIYASPDILIKSTDKVTALNGVTASDFTGKSGFAVIVDGTDLNMATSGKLLFNNHNELKLGADLDLSIKKIYTTSTNGDIELDPNGTGDVILGNYTLDGDQTVGAGQDNYVLTYDHASATISLEEAGVTAVTGTAPIVSSGGATPAVSISAATTSAAGSMSSADKTILNTIAGAFVNDDAGGVKNLTFESTDGISASAGVIVSIMQDITADNTNANSKDFLGVVTSTADTCVINGLVEITGQVPNGATAGRPLWLGTSGTFISAAPTAANAYSRVVGHYVGTLSAGSYGVFFNPSNDWVQIS